MREIKASTELIKLAPALIELEQLLTNEDRKLQPDDIELVNKLINQMASQADVFANFTFN